MKTLCELENIAELALENIDELQDKRSSSIGAQAAEAREVKSTAG